MKKGEISPLPPTSKVNSLFPIHTYLVTSFSGPQLGHYVHDLSLPLLIYWRSSNSERPSQARLALSIGDEEVEK